MNAAPVRRTKQLRQHIISYLMILPAIAFLSVFVIYPMLHLIQLSLYTGNANNPYKKFVLFENFRQILFVKPDFMIAVRNTAVYTVSMVVLLIFFAVIFALWMYKDRAINRVAQTVFFTPHLVATISCAFIWSWLYNSNSYGLFNSILAMFGINPIRWLDTTDTAMLSVII